MRKSGGFSLVEVVTALGIVSFALVALLGLFSVGINASRQSSEDTVVASMAWQALSKLRNQPAAVAIGTTNYYFDVRGEQTNTTSALNAYYQCQVVTRKLQAGEISPDTVDLTQATLIFTWPSSVATGKRPYTNILHATFPPK